jgi:hypothetical protein
MPRAPVFAALCLLAPLAAHAAGPFDGTYRGSQTTIRTNNSASCAHMDRDNVVVTVTDSSFSRTWGAGKNGGEKITARIAADGSFTGEAIASVRVTRNAMHQYKMSGRIAGGVLEGEIGSNLCAVRMTLRKS